MHQCVLMATNEKWMNLARKIARHLYYTHRLSLSWDDTIGWAFLGLVEGLSRLKDLSSEGQRHSYLSIKIGGAILDAARRHVRIHGQSVGFSMDFMEWRNAIYIEARLSCPPTPEEVTLEGEERLELRDALRGLSCTDMEVLSAIYDARRVGDNAHLLASRRGVHPSTIYRQHTRVVKRLKEEIGGRCG